MATNQVLIGRETPIVFSDATTGGDLVIDCGGLAAGSVRQSQQWDRGVSGPYPEIIEVRFIVDGFTANPVKGESIDLYVGFSDGINHDGPLGTGDAASSIDFLPNLDPVVSAVVRSTVAADQIVVSKRIYTASRFVTFAVHNNTAANTLKSSGDAHKIICTQTPHEV